MEVSHQQTNPCAPSVSRVILHRNIPIQVFRAFIDCFCAVTNKQTKIGHLSRCCWTNFDLF